MGLCSSSNMTPEEREAAKLAKERNARIEKEMKSAHRKDAQINKLLLLGAGESGKSTFFKQLTMIYAEGFNNQARQGFISIMHINCIDAMKTICQQLLKDSVYTEALESLSPEDLSDAQLMAECKTAADAFDESVAQIIDRLWKTDAIQTVYNERANYQLFDSAGYVLDKVMTYASKDWVPDENDIVHARVRTTGIVQKELKIEGNTFHIYDVGGQRNERKKWIHCFQDVTAVLFLVAISEYDQKLFEDEKVNRMDEALNLFDEITNMKWFRETPIILFLNKRDLFAEKIQKVPLTVWDPDYDGTNSYDEATDYITEVFSKRKANPRDLYVHLTCATDKTNVQVVFTATKDIVVRQSLRAGGLMM
jgi:GTPase SAR1 family protein